jgi:hypothetical protein
LSIANSKLSMNYVYRRIKETTAGFGRPVQGAVGYVDLSPEWLSHLTTTKDDIREDSRDLEDALMAAIATALEPLISRLQHAKRSKVFTNVRFNLKRRFQAGFTAIANRSGSSGSHGAGGGRGSDRESGRPHKEPLAAEIDIVKSSDASMGGFLCRVDLDAQYAVAYVNEDHPIVTTALDAEPVNQRLLEQVLIQALATEMVKADALVSFGLLSKAAAAELMELYQGNALDVLLHVHRLLTDGVLQPEVA